MQPREPCLRVSPALAALIRVSWPVQELLAALAAATGADIGASAPSASSAAAEAAAVGADAADADVAGGLAAACRVRGPPAAPLPSNWLDAAAKGAAAAPPQPAAAPQPTQLDYATAALNSTMAAMRHATGELRAAPFDAAALGGVLKVPLHGAAPPTDPNAALLPEIYEQLGLQPGAAARKPSREGQPGRQAPAQAGGFGKTQRPFSPFADWYTQRQGLGDLPTYLGDARGLGRSTSAPGLPPPRASGTPSLPPFAAP